MGEINMTIIHAQLIGDKALLTRNDFERLVELARLSENVEVEVYNDVPTSQIMWLAEQSGSFDFWKEAGEDIYSIEDGEPV